EFCRKWIDPQKLAVIEAACSRCNGDNYQRLKPLKQMLPPEITYDEIRLVVASIRRQNGTRNTLSQP
ncbi:MAG TPA: helix-turn-helix domain-containing protein, partial [Candidatus Sulfotelmatobacter sp.]|nr:helix-turn-helix domain-containing protein [Candidatus Sulfotelmatobacter sp.]